jgi:flagellar basal-body rod protein FlgC
MSGPGKLFSGLRIAASAMSAERVRIDTIAKNIANARTTRVPGSTAPYRRQVVHFAPLLERARNGQVEVTGVRVTEVSPDLTTDFESVHDPSHPDADANGTVFYPNVNTMKEMADLITAVRAYEANIGVQENFVQMARRALRLAE